MHELSYGITSNNPHFGAVRNPWDSERIPGGSSGGSAAAVAADLVFAAWERTLVDPSGSRVVLRNRGVQATFGGLAALECCPWHRAWITWECWRGTYGIRRRSLKRSSATTRAIPLLRGIT